MRHLKWRTTQRTDLQRKDGPLATARGPLVVVFPTVPEGPKEDSALLRLPYSLAAGRTRQTSCRGKHNSVGVNIATQGFPSAANADLDWLALEHNRYCIQIIRRISLLTSCIHVEIRIVVEIKSVVPNIRSKAIHENP